MVELEMDGFILQVPLKAKMTIHEFIEAVDKVEHLSRANERGMHAHDQMQPVQYVPPVQYAAPVQQPQVFAQPTPVPSFVPAAQPISQLREEDFKLPGEEGTKVQHLSNQVRSHVEHLKRHEDVLGRHEKHLGEILQYLQSLDRYIRR